MLQYLRKNMKTIMIVVAVMFAATIFYGLGYRGLRGVAPERKTGIGSINGKEIDPSRFNQIMNQYLKTIKGHIKPQEGAYLQILALNQTIDFELMLSQAERTVKVSNGEINSAISQIMTANNIKSIDDLKKILKNAGMSYDVFRKTIRDDLLIQKMIGKIKSSVSLNPEDMREIRARHILLTDEAEALVILDKIKKGADFAALAKKYSIDVTSKDKGGDLGYFTTGTTIPEFEKVAFSLKPGDIGGPVKTSYGYHIIKVEDTRLRKTTQKGKDLKTAILEEKQQKAVNSWLYDLKKKSKVEIHNPALRAYNLRLAGRISEAIAEYEKAIGENPGNSYLYLLLGDTYESIGKTDLAISEYKQAATLNPSDPDILITLGRAYQKETKLKLAIEQFRKASAVAGENRQLREELAEIFKELSLTKDEKHERSEIERIEAKEKFEKEIEEKLKKH